MEEKVDLYEIVIVILLMVDLFGLLLMISTQRDIKEFNERQNTINEYIFNRVGG